MALLRCVAMVEHSPAAGRSRRMSMTFPMAAHTRTIGSACVGAARLLFWSRGLERIARSQRMTGFDYEGSPSSTESEA